MPGRIQTFKAMLPQNLHSHPQGARSPRAGTSGEKPAFVSWCSFHLLLGSVLSRPQGPGPLVAERTRAIPRQ